MSSTIPDHDPKPCQTLSRRAKWRGGLPAVGWSNQSHKQTEDGGSSAKRAKHVIVGWPRPKQALRTYAFLLVVAFALLLGGEFLLDRFPTKVSVAGNDLSAAVSVGGTTRAVTLPKPIVAVRFLPSESYRREFAIDGSDSVNNGTIDTAYLARIGDTPYYRFQAWLRDEASYSSWRNLIIRDKSEQRLFRETRPADGETMAVPSGFELTADLRRIEIPRVIELVDDDDNVVQIAINRNDKWVRVSSSPAVEPGAIPELGSETTLEQWYFTREWQPELALVLYLLMRVCAVAIFLVLLIAPVAALLPARLPQLQGKAVRPVLLALLLTTTFATSAYASIVLFDMAPHIYDAYAYYFQAQIFAEGMLYAPIPSVPDAFNVAFTVHHNDKWFSMYTPGTSLVLALGAKAGAIWLVGPLLATGGVLLTYAAASRQFGWRTALLAAGLMASSPFLHLQAGSFMSHVPGMFWGAMVLFAAVRYIERRARGWAILGAAALGFLFITREMSAIVYALTLGSYVAWRTGVVVWRSRDDRWRIAGDAIAVATCLAIFAGGYLLYNRALTGSATLLPRALYSEQENRYGFGDNVGFYGQHTLGGGLVNADEMLTSLGITLFGWPFYLALALIALPFVLRRAQTWDWVHGAIAGGFVLAYIGLYYHGITYGPRYYLDALPALVLLAARGFVVLAGAAAAICRDAGRRRAQPRAELAALLLGLLLVLCNGLYFWPQQARVHADLTNRPGTSDLVLGDFIERRITGRVATLSNAIVVTRDGGLLELLGPLNCPRLDCQTIFAYAPNEDVETQLRAAFPGRDWYLVEAQEGVLRIHSLEVSHSPLAR